MDRFIAGTAVLTRDQAIEIGVLGYVVLRRQRPVMRDNCNSKDVRFDDCSGG